jgi:hypothetical protein
LAYYFPFFPLPFLHLAINPLTYSWLPFLLAFVVEAVEFLEIRQLVEQEQELVPYFAVLLQIVPEDSQEVEEFALDLAALAVLEPH